MQIKGTSFNHAALLVPDLDKAAAACRALGFHTDPPQTFSGEGTREVYVGNRKSHGGRLLLIQAISDGPYARAFQKRGAGLHHIAVDVTDAEEFAGKLAGSGWLLHPSSLHTLKSSRTLWLARPGLPALVEVQERESLDMKPAFISRIRMPALSSAHEKMLHTLGITQACAENDDGLTLVIQNQKLRLSDII